MKDWYFSIFNLYSTNRRDFRLLVADPNNPDKPWPHPVFWYTEASVIEVYTHIYVHLFRA